MHDEIISIISGSPVPVLSRDIAEQMGEEEVTREIVNTLAGLVSDGTLARRGRYYELTNGKLDTGTTDSNPRKRELLPTDPDKKRNNARNKARRKHRQVQAEENTQPITTLEEIEQMVEDSKGLDAALDRLESSIANPVIAPALPNAETKVSMLRKFAEVFEDSIARECAELADWVRDVRLLDKNVRRLLE